MEKEIRVGIVGSGNAAVFHYASYLRVTGIPVKVVGVTSLDKAQRETFARSRGIQAFASLSEMFPEVDLIDNCTPGYAHEPVSVAGFEAGKHVIVEKPFTGYYGPSQDAAFEGNRFPKEKMLEEALPAPGALSQQRSRAKRSSAMQRTGFTLPPCRKKPRFSPRAKGRFCGRSVTSPIPAAPPCLRGLEALRRGLHRGEKLSSLSAILYLKQIEGMTHYGKAIRPKTVSARTHEITRNPRFKDKGF